MTQLLSVQESSLNEEVLKEFLSVSLKHIISSKLTKQLPNFFTNLRALCGDAMDQSFAFTLLKEALIYTVGQAKTLVADKLLNENLKSKPLMHFDAL